MWNADTTDHIQAFEASSLEVLSSDIANYYAEDGDTICQIEAVYFENDHGSRSTLSDMGIELFAGDCEHQNEHLINEAEAEDKANRENRSDYYANIL